MPPSLKLKQNYWNPAGNAHSRAVTLSWLEIDPKQLCEVCGSCVSLSREGKSFMLSEVAADILGPVSLPSALLGVADSD